MPNDNDRDIESQIEATMEPLKHAYAKGVRRLNELLDEPPRDKDGRLDISICTAIRLSAEMAGKLVTKHEVSPGSSALDEIPADELRAMAAERERLLLAKVKEKPGIMLTDCKVQEVVLRSRTERAGG